MPYYHVFIWYRDTSGKLDVLLSFNKGKEDVQKQVATPYLKNKHFLFVGKRFHESLIDRILIFQSEKKFQKLVLPNGQPIMDADNFHIANCFARGEVKGVRVCTSEIITTLEKEEPIEIPAKLPEKKKEVFIVHGRDETPALRLQKYLNQNLKIKARMFEDFKEKSGSNTIIEQLEYVKDNVGYAFVIVTPDDLGCLRKNIDKCRTTMLVGRTSVTVKSVCDILDNLHTRARQNVVFEHGLFIGALGRYRVCCLLHEDTKEKPSDIDGILYVGFKKSVKETFPEITEKLKKAGLVKAQQ